MRNLPALAESLMPIAAGAGAAIMRIYDSGFTVQRKDDNSPLTAADLESQRVIMEGLKRITPDIPILSEESAAAPWPDAAFKPARRNSRCAWSAAVPIPVRRRRRI